MHEQKAKMSPRWQRWGRARGTSGSRNPVSHPGFLGENAPGGEAERGQARSDSHAPSQTRRAFASGYRTPQPGTPSS